MNRRNFLKAAALAAPCSLRGDAPPLAGVVRLYGRTARFEGAAAMDRLKISMQWTGTASAAWTVEAPRG
jgi:hypothetical protein